MRKQSLHPDKLARSYETLPEVLGITDSELSLRHIVRKRFYKQTKSVVEATLPRPLFNYKSKSVSEDVKAVIFPPNPGQSLPFVSVTRLSPLPANTKRRKLVIRMPEMTAIQQENDRVQRQKEVFEESKRMLEGWKSRNEVSIRVFGGWKQYYRLLKGKTEDKGRNKAFTRLDFTKKPGV